MVIIDKIYFYVNKTINKIYKGRVKNYEVTCGLPCDESIFINIFAKLNYSGFACVDFTIYNGKISIFEINPRIGGSLVFNVIYFNRFFTKLIEYYNDTKYKTELKINP